MNPKRLLALVVLAHGCTEPPEDHRVRVANWSAKAPDYPFTSDSDDACRVELAFEPEDLPSSVELPEFESLPAITAAIRSIAPEDCYDQTVASYAIATDYDADGDSDFVVRRPRAQACLEVEVGIVRSEAGVLGVFELLPDLRHLFLVGSLDDDAHADLIAVVEGCASVVAYDDLLGFDHDQSTPLGCGTSIGGDENTVTTWDLDRDGDLDVLFGNDGENFYFRNELDAGGGFVEAITEIGLTPAGAYAYDPDDPALASDPPFDPLRAHSFYISCDYEDPFDPLSPSICQVDNDGFVSFNESYRCDDSGQCEWIDDRVAAQCDITTISRYQKYLCETKITTSQFDNLVTIAAQTRGFSRAQALRIAHSSGSPESGDGSNPMSITRFGIWPYAFEHKAQSEGLIWDTVVSFDRARYRDGAAAWRLFEPYAIDNGYSSNGHEQETWGSFALENGSGWPILVMARGKSGALDGLGNGPPMQLLQQILETPLDCLRPPDSPIFGWSDIGVSVLGPDGRFVTLGEIIELDDGTHASTGPITEVGVYVSIAASWIQLDATAEPKLGLLIGGFDGALRAYDVALAGNVLRLSLDAGPGRAPHGYGAIVFVEIDGRMRGPKIIGAEGVQPQLGNHRESWDFGLGEAEVADVYVLWPSGEIERFAGVPAGSAIQPLIHGEGQADPQLPSKLSRVLDRQD